MKRLIRTILLVLILGGVGFFGYQAVINRQINVNHWFVGEMARGVDLSSYQGEVDFSKLKSQGVEFAFVKATEGASYVDSRFLENWEGSRAAGVPTGAYHFFSYTESGAEQAAHYIKTVGELSGRLIPAVDLELSTAEKTNPPEKDTVVRSLRVFVAAIEEKYGVKPMIYATKEYFNKYLKDDFSEYPRWVRSVFWPVYLEAGEDWAVWQYDDHAKLEGYAGEEEFIDMDVVNSKIGVDGLKMPE